MATKKTVATVSLNLTRDAWKDLDAAILDAQVAARSRGHEAMRERLSAIRKGIEAEVWAQHPRW